jgi:hypothetical protein
MNNIDIFTNIYENNIWGNDSSIDNLYKGTSGGGSEINHCRQYIDFVREFIIKNKINKVIDLGCGDWQASCLIYEKLDNICYYGYDAYEKLIISHKNQYPDYSFIHLDFVDHKEKIESGDLCILKDVLQHLSNISIDTLLNYLIKEKKFKYILITNDGNQKSNNININNGEYRRLSANFDPLKKFKPKIIYGYKNKEISLVEL